MSPDSNSGFLALVKIISQKVMYLFINKFKPFVTMNHSLQQQGFHLEQHESLVTLCHLFNNSEDFSCFENLLHLDQRRS